MLAEPRSSHNRNPKIESLMEVERLIIHAYFRAATKLSSYLRVPCDHTFGAACRLPQDATTAVSSSHVGPAPC